LHFCDKFAAAAAAAACDLLQALDFQAQQRLWALQQDELAAAGTSALQDAAAAQAAALAAEQARTAAEWQAQDEARALKQQHEAARRARLVAAAEQEAAQQAARGLLLAQELQTQEKLHKVRWQLLWAQQYNWCCHRPITAICIGRHHRSWPIDMLWCITAWHSAQ
jgi:hypothetical protein